MLPFSTTATPRKKKERIRFYYKNNEIPNSKNELDSSNKIMKWIHDRQTHFTK